MKAQIKIVLCEEKELLRKSFASFIRTNPEFKLLDEARNSKDLFDKIKEQEPDIVLLGTDAETVGIKSLLYMMCNRFPLVKAVALSFSGKADLGSEIMTYGARSYLNSNCTPSDFFHAIKTVHEKDYFFDQSVSRSMLHSIVKERNSSALLQDISFTEKEREVLLGVCEGKTNKQMAKELFISESTVDFHRTKIFSKTKCDKAVKLLRFALKKGMIEL